MDKKKLEQIESEIRKTIGDPNHQKLIEIKRLSETTSEMLKSSKALENDRFRKVSDNLASISKKLEQIDQKEVEIPEFPTKIEISNFPEIKKEIVKFPENLKELKNFDPDPIIKALEGMSKKTGEMLAEAVSKALAKVYIKNHKPEEYIPVRIVYGTPDGIKFDPKQMGGGSAGTPPAFHTGWKDESGAEAYVILGADDNLQVGVLDSNGDRMDPASEQTLLDVKHAIESGGGGAVKRYMAPTSFATVNGGVASGTIDNAKYHDGTYLVLSEVSGDGLTDDFTFNVGAGTQVVEVIFHGRYEGSISHYIDVFAYDYNLSTWVEISGEDIDITTGTVDLERIFSLAGNPNFVKSDGEVKIRLKHSVATYNSSHRLYVDYLNVSYYVTAVAITNPTDPYELYETEYGATYNYICKEDKDGNWYIQRETISSGLREYAVGTGSVATAWTNRATQSYGLFSTKF